MLRRKRKRGEDADVRGCNLDLKGEEEEVMEIQSDRREQSENERKSGWIKVSLWTPQVEQQSLIRI